MDSKEKVIAAVKALQETVSNLETRVKTLEEKKTPETPPKKKSFWENEED